MDAHSPHVLAAVAADSGCRVWQRVHSSRSFPQTALGWHTQHSELNSHSAACEIFWVTENEEFTLSWLRQQQTLPGAVSHSAAGVCFLVFSFPLFYPNNVLPLVPHPSSLLTDCGSSSSGTSLAVIRINVMLQTGRILLPHFGYYPFILLFFLEGRHELQFL